MPIVTMSDPELVKKVEEIFEKRHDDLKHEIVRVVGFFLGDKYDLKDVEKAMEQATVRNVK